VTGSASVQVVREGLAQQALADRWLAQSERVEEPGHDLRVGIDGRAAFDVEARERPPDLLEHPEVAAGDGVARAGERR
jgi:hypothetical protein